MNEPGTPPWRDREAGRLITFGRAAALPQGGFGWLGIDGAVDATKPCPLYLNARMTYVFTLAHLAGVAGAGPLATAGIAAFDRYADAANGGWLASIAPGGQVLDTTKANYDHAAALLAASSAAAAGIAGADAVLAVTTDAIEQHFWSAAEGCARESWDAGFTESEPYRGANSNMHSVEAYLAAADVTGDLSWRDRAVAIATRLIGDYARANAWRVPEHYNAQWQPQPDYHSDRRTDQFRPYGTTPGHSFEWARLLLALEAALGHPPEGQAALGQPEPGEAVPGQAPEGQAEPGQAARAAPPAWLAEAAVALFDTAVADAWHRDGHPGLIYTVGAGGQPVVPVRLHWVACEAVLAADALHRRTGDGRFADLAARWWEEIDRYFIDREHGGWWQELTPDMTPGSATVSGKPDLYHAYQALLFPSLPLSPVAAVALSGRGHRGSRP